MIDLKTPEDILSQIKKLADDNNLSDNTTDGIVGIFQKISNQESIDDHLAKRIGQYFYYYAQIDDILTKIVNSLLPELDIKIVGLDSSRGRNSFFKKVELIKSLTPNSDQLKIFSLLEKINSIRNKLAHESPNNLDIRKINQEFVGALKEAFALSQDGDIFRAITKSDKSADDAANLVKIMLCSKIYIELFADIEILGKSEDTALSFFEAIRKFSSLYVRRRFSILAYQIQTMKKSTERVLDSILPLKGLGPVNAFLN